MDPKNHLPKGTNNLIKNNGVMFICQRIEYMYLISLKMTKITNFRTELLDFLLTLCKNSERTLVFLVPFSGTPIGDTRKSLSIFSGYFIA